MKRFLLFSLMLLLVGACADGKVRQYKLQVVKDYPHDTQSYTQGLFFDGGNFYESTGQFGESTFRIVDLTTGKARRKLDFGKKYFVEGPVILGGDLFILTWTNKVAFVYDAATLQYKQTYTYPREGWGLTTDGKQLIASDGSSRLYFMDTQFKMQRTVTVKLNGRPVNMLNELEYIDGKVWANVYTSDMILIIDPKSGNVEATVDCTGLLPRQLRDNRTDVLNGIAYDPATKKTYLTGKYWPRLYEVKLVEK
ncbi:MAG: glutaminyl-peptide cyclotransferase [Bacteroidales bacterium]|nr:glutaminyl-peptide cyclotransferase [Bacteroidales bacterium]